MSQKTRVVAPAAALGLAIVAVAGSGTAYAYYKTSATGTGTASTISGNAVTLTVSGTVGAGSLLPGGSVPVNVTVTDPSTSKSMSITSVTPSTISASGGKSTCGVTKVHWDRTTTLPQAIVAGGSAVPVNGNFVMDSDVEDGCQGATFTFTLTVTGTLG